MKKLMMLLLIGVFFVSCSDDDLKPESIELEKNEMTIDHSANSLTIKVSPDTWRFYGVRVNDSKHENELLFTDDTEGPLVGEWFKLSKNNSSNLAIEIQQNTEANRTIIVTIDNGGTSRDFKLIQKAKR